MSNQLSHSDIPTTWLFGNKRGFTWNPVRGCANYSCPLHPKNKGKCWAAQLCRFHAGPWAESDYSHNPMDGLHDKSIMIKIRKDALENFEPFWFESQYDREFPKKQSCIAVGYQTDLAFVPVEWTSRIIAKILDSNRERKAAGLPLHVFQFLTKAPDKLYPCHPWPLNCWLGFTAMDGIGFYSGYEWIIRSNNNSNLIYAYLEPLIKPIDISYSTSFGPLFDWVIVGGGDQPLNPDWVRNIRDQCQTAGIKFFFKSWGNWLPYWCPLDKKYKYNKALRGHKYNVLDGEKREQFPEIK